MLNKRQLYKLVHDNTMLNDEKLSFLISGVIHLTENKISGDVVECGVWMGGSDVLLANTLLECRDERTFHLFDSFDDPHEPLPIDGAWALKKLGGLVNAKGRLNPIKGFYRRQTKIGPGDEKHVYDLLVNSVGYPKEKINIHKGWFQNTMVPCSQTIENIGLLILDCDFYVSIKICIENLYNKIVNGGVVVIDDYTPMDGCRKAVDAYLLGKKINDKPTMINGTSFEEYAGTNGGKVWIKKI
jgi:O-methyltransferase